MREHFKSFFAEFFFGGRESILLRLIDVFFMRNGLNLFFITCLMFRYNRRVSLV